MRETYLVHVGVVRNISIVAVGWNNKDVLFIFPKKHEIQLRSAMPIIQTFKKQGICPAPGEIGLLGC